jgi:hypothetical protein
MGAAVLALSILMSVVVARDATRAFQADGRTRASLLEGL